MRPKASQSQEDWWVARYCICARMEPEPAKALPRVTKSAGVNVRIIEK